MIQRLAPSLAPHRDCTIIDINPGQGLFSSRLHDFLKPRSHILVEPIQAYHQPFLQILVDTPNSKYHLRNWQGRDAFELSSYAKEGLVSVSEPGTSNIVEENGRNDSILVLANVARGKIPKADTSSLKNSHFRVLAFMNALRRGAGLHSQGPVRMLLWLADKEKDALLPQTVSTRKKTALQLEAYFHVEEIVGGGSQRQQHRERTLDMTSGEQVAKRMETAGIQIPPCRQDQLYKEVESAMSTSVGGDLQVSSDPTRDWQRELQQLQLAFDEGKFSQFEGGPRGPHEARRKKHEPFNTLTPQFQRLRQLRAHDRHGNRRQIILEGLLEAEAKVDLLESELLHENLDQADRDNKVKERDRIRDELKTSMKDKQPSFIAKFAFLGDDRRALALKPPLLMWDRREAEPLVVQDEEFYSPRKLALLDLRPLVPLPYPMTEEQLVYFDYLSSHLLHNGAENVKSLNHLAPGAFEALAPQVSALRDPLKGGRHGAEDLRGRSMTPEMVYRLALAWDQWAFKPPLSQVVDRGSSVESLSNNVESSPFGALYTPPRE